MNRLFIVATLLLLGLPAAADPRVAALYRESYLLEAKGDAPRALGKLQEVRALAGESYFLVARVAWLSYLAGDFAGAVGGYRRALALEPKSVEARLGLTLPIMAQRQWRDLERACRDLLGVAPHHAVGRARLAHALYSLGNFPDAASVYRKLIAEYPAELDHRTGLGWALLRMGRRAEARKLFEEVLVLSPDNPNAKDGLRAP